jgi:hypothetical protein
MQVRKLRVIAKESSVPSEIQPPLCAVHVYTVDVPRVRFVNGNDGRSIAGSTLESKILARSD